VPLNPGYAHDHEPGVTITLERATCTLSIVLGA
jgi:hypothetical protein